MRKFIVKKTGEPIEIGQVLRRTEKKDFSFGTYESIREDLLTDSTVEVFIKQGIIEEVTNKVKRDIPTDINYYVLRVAKAMNMEVTAVYDWLDLMNKSGYSLAVLNILLKEVKSVINHTYGGKEIPEKKWTINVENGEIFSVNSPKGKYLNLFYSREDCELAKRIISRQLLYMGLNGGK